MLSSLERSRQFWGSGVTSGLPGNDSFMAHPSLTPNRSSRTILVLAVTLLGLRVIVGGILPATRDAGGDFANFYTAANLVAEGESLVPAYSSFPWFQKQMDRLGFGGQLGGFIPHPPPAALLFLPLAGFDPLTAKRVWTVLNGGLLLVCILLLARVSGIGLLPSALILLLTGPGLVNQFLFGQLYLLLLVSLLAGLSLAERGRGALAGICFGLLTPIKYVGLVWIAYFAWKKQWRLVLAAVLTILALGVAALWLVGEDSFRVFLSQVLPRHLAGEVQDPFALRFQSWNSLWRRLFVAEPQLNPAPLWNQPVLFFVFRSLTTFALLGLTVALLGGARFADPKHTRLFGWGWLGLFPLLASPGAASYHFLLLSIAAACFVRILLDQGRLKLAWGTILVFGLVNLPHYLWLEGLGHGWTTPLAYSRLAVLTLYALLLIAGLRSRIHFRISRNWAVGLALAACLAAITGRRSYQPQDSDGAEGATPVAGQLAGKGGMIQFAPSVGTRRWTFSSLERDPDGYSVYQDDGQRWPLPGGRNYFAADLAADDRSLLVETIDDGISRIWLSRAGEGTPLSLARGERPRWSPDGSGFLFLEQGSIHWRPKWEETSETILHIAEPVTEAAFLTSESIVFTKRGTNGYRLAIFEISRQTESVLLESPSPLSSPRPAGDGRGLLFVWEQSGDRDVWAMDLSDRSLTRVTSHRGNDQDPVWDARGRRILFASDRGRGLAFTTLYSIPPPRFLEED